MTWKEANAYCAEEGGRLPTIYEVESGCVAKIGACSDTAFVWTSDDEELDHAVPSGGEMRSLTSDDSEFMFYTLEVGKSRCEYESIKIQNFEECIEVVEYLGLEISSQKKI